MTIDQKSGANPIELVGVTLEGKYEILSEVARGGMGIVYRGIDQSLGRPVAIKVLFKRYNSDNESVERFRREARAMASLDHPNIVPVYAIGHEYGVHYFVMKFLTGWTVSERLKRHRLGLADPFGIEEVRDVLIQLCSGLDHAHRRSLIHRDIKPGNIMIAPDGHTSIMDFGIVKESDNDTLTKTGIVFGTPDYMAPEHAQGQPPSPETDLYSLGIVAYEMLTGEQPFRGGTPFSLVLKHIKEPPPPLIERRKDLHQQFQDVIFKVLEKKPEDRYSSAQQMAEALRSLSFSPSAKQNADESISTRTKGHPPPPPRPVNMVSEMTHPGPPPTPDSHSSFGSDLSNYSSQPPVDSSDATLIEAPSVDEPRIKRAGLPPSRPNIVSRSEANQTKTVDESVDLSEHPQLRAPGATVDENATRPGYYGQAITSKTGPNRSSNKALTYFIGTIVIVGLIGSALVMFLKTG
ncbi:MAG: serine/threonine-protein kinase [Myxococcota bacterium]|nr:serine/threonine-protein kinase [Myxococcota bacterium]